MLNAMRENAGSWMIKVLLGIIVVAFIFMGAGSFNASRTSKIASVNGDPITVNQYQRAYSEVINSLRSQFGDRLNDDMIKMFNVKQQALDSLIEKTLLRQAAERYNLRVPDSELADLIAKIPVFQNNGTFDAQRYKLLLSQNRLTAESFETMQKEAILMDKLRTSITKTAKVSKLETEAWYSWENMSVDINYVAFLPQSFDDVEITDKMIEEYYNANKEKYKTAPTIQARYVKFDPEKYKTSITISEDEIQQYYEDHQKEFKVEETVSASHILFKLDEKADQKAVEAAKLKAIDVLAKARAGEDFAELAKTYSEGPSKDKGGKLGAFKREDMVKPFADAAFSMKAGDISEPVKTQFGWHIIKVEEHNEAGITPLEKASAEINDRLLGRKAKNLAYDAAVALYDITFDGEEFVNNSKDSGLELITTDFFTQKNGPKGSDTGPAFAEAAFKLPLMEISDIIEIGENYFLLQTIKKEPEKIPAPEDVKEQLTKDTKWAQQNKAAEEAANKFLETAKSAGSLEKAATGDPSIEITTTGAMHRTASVPGIGNDRVLRDAAFRLTESAKISDKVINAETGLYVIELKSRTTPLAQGLKIAEKNISDRMMQQKQMGLYKAWMANLKGNSEINISEKFMGN